MNNQISLTEIEKKYANVISACYRTLTQMGNNPMGREEATQKVFDDLKYFGITGASFEFVQWVISEIERLKDLE